MKRVRMNLIVLIVFLISLFCLSSCTEKPGTNTTADTSEYSAVGLETTTVAETVETTIGDVQIETATSKKPDNSTVLATTKPNVTTSLATTKPQEINIFAQLPEEFIFSSGAGAWRTTLQIKEDGRFTGLFEDSNMGESGEGYLATRYECHFNGKFNEVKKINEYEYSIQTEYLNTEGTLNEEKIIGQVRVITAGPYGFENANEFRLYLPGRSTADLPEDFLGWLSRQGTPDMEKLSVYGLHNLSGDEGFFSALS